MQADIYEIGPRGGRSRVGKMEFTALPRIGEWVFLDFERATSTYEVVGVLHRGANTRPELYLRWMGKGTSPVEELCKSQEGILPAS